MNGKTFGAYLVMHCGFPTTDYSGLLPPETILGDTAGVFNAPGTGGGIFVDVSDLANSQLGAVHPISVNANAQNRSNGARVRFFYTADDMQAIVEGVGQTLKLTIGGGSGAKPTAQAIFSLPEDNVAVKQMMSSCLQKSLAQAQALRARTVASCPQKAGKILESVDLKYASTGKTLPGDMDEIDNGGSWKLLPSAKGRSVVMNCAYKDAAGTYESIITDKAVVSVPLTASTCKFSVERNELRNKSICLSAASSRENK